MSLYNKYRPLQLSNVVGQARVVRALTKQAESNKFFQVYLFAGPKGTGKTTMGRIVAALLNCQARKGTQVCGKCRFCLGIKAGHAPDVHEIDGASNNGVEQAKALKEKAYYAPIEGKQSVYLLDECHMLTTAAWNSLLKVTEEPPEFVTFILCTTDPQKVIPAILSRCQRYQFSVVPEEGMAERLMLIAKKENITLEQDAALGLSRLAMGSLRDAITYLEQAAVTMDNKVTTACLSELFGQPEKRVSMELAKMVVEQNPTKVLGMVDDLIANGADARGVIIDVADVFRDAMVLQAGAEGIVRGSEAEKEILRGISKKVSQGCLIGIAKTLGRVDKEINLNIRPRTVLEAALLSCIQSVVIDGKTPNGDSTKR